MSMEAFRLYFLYAYVLFRYATIRTLSKFQLSLLKCMEC